MGCSTPKTNILPEAHKNKQIAPYEHTQVNNDETVYWGHFW